MYLTTYLFWRATRAPYTLLFSLPPSLGSYVITFLSRTLYAFVRARRCRWHLPEQARCRGLLSVSLLTDKGSPQQRRDAATTTTHASGTHTPRATPAKTWPALPHPCPGVLDTLP